MMEIVTHHLYLSCHKMQIPLSLEDIYKYIREFISIDFAEIYIHKRVFSIDAAQLIITTVSQYFTSTWFWVSFVISAQLLFSIL